MELDNITNMSARIGLFEWRWVPSSPNSTIETTWGNRHNKRDVGNLAQVTGVMILTHSEYHSRITLGQVYHQTKPKNNYDTVHTTRTTAAIRSSLVDQESSRRTSVASRSLLVDQQSTKSTSVGYDTEILVTVTLYMQVCINIT